MNRRVHKSADLAPKLRWLAPVLKFFTHTVVGTAVFGVIAIPAVVLSCSMEKLPRSCASSVSLLLGVGEYALLIVDLSLFLVFLGKTAVVAAREIWTTPDGCGSSNHRRRTRSE